MLGYQTVKVIAERKGAVRDSCEPKSLTLLVM